jgi:hypothetical protein
MHQAIPAMPGHLQAFSWGPGIGNSVNFFPGPHALVSLPWALIRQDVCAEALILRIACFMYCKVKARFHKGKCSF